jgi:hypothetical protein
MGYIPINPSSPLALKALFLLALPREANETSIFKLVREGLGKNRPIDLQSVSQWPPKPFWTFPSQITEILSAARATRYDRSRAAADTASESTSFDTHFCATRKAERVRR